ncbi:hypothetical protein [Lacticaseibacillus paracasei]|uniref:hypothetical protein n=1 Tax=Lacticaseibacillus paracasei TaxID=1597 RepID=UPI003BA13F07
MQKLKFLIISYMLNADQRVNLGAALMRRNTQMPITRHDAYEMLKKESAAANPAEFYFTLWDAAVFGPEDSQDSRENHILLLH